MGHGRLAGRGSIGAQRARHGGDRLHRGADPEHLAGAHAALDAAGADATRGAIRRRRRGRSRRGRAAPAPGQLEAVADLDALDGLDPISAPASRASSRRSQCTCEPRPGGSPRPPPRPPRRACRRRAGRPRCRRSCAAPPRRRSSAPGCRRSPPGPPGVGSRPSGGRTLPSATTWLQHGDPERLLEEAAGDRAERDAGRGLPGAGALQDRPGLVEVVLLHAHQVGVTWPGPGQRRVAGPSLEHARRRPDRPTSRLPTSATRCCRPGWRSGRPGSARAVRRR